MGEARMYHVQAARDIEPAEPADLAGRVSGLRRAGLVGRHVGAVHSGLALCSLEPGGEVGTHLHSTEQSFYVLRGNPEVVVEGCAHRLAPDECGFLSVGSPHAWRNPTEEETLWLEATAPAPRISGPPDTFWTGEPLPPSSGTPLDIRDPRTRTFFRLSAGEMDLDMLKVGARVDAPTVSASMATALLAYSGIAVKMLIDGRLGAVLHTMFMVEYEPGGVAQPHDHPLEETYYMLEGEVEAMAEDDEFILRPGDVFWTSVGCVHAFRNKSQGRVRWLETQSPQPPANHSYRFNRDWDYLAERLA